MSVGRNIQYLREARGWSLFDFSGLTGISVPDCELIERGERVVSSAEIQRICKVMGINIDDLFRKRDFDEEDLEDQGSVLMPVDKLQDLLNQMK